MRGHDGSRSVARNSFASIASHDLRNPLQVTQARLELAREEYDSKHLGDVAEAHERMKTFIDDLLTLARTGNQIDETEMVDRAEMIDSCWRTVETVDAWSCYKFAELTRDALFNLVSPRGGLHLEESLDEIPELILEGEISLIDHILGMGLPLRDDPNTVVSKEEFRS